jgi:hypothetical protein
MMSLVLVLSFHWTTYRISVISGWMMCPKAHFRQQNCLLVITPSNDVKLSFPFPQGFEYPHTDNCETLRLQIAEITMFSLCTLHLPAVISLCIAAATEPPPPPLAHYCSRSQCVAPRKSQTSISRASRRHAPFAPTQRLRHEDAAPGPHRSCGPHAPSRRSRRQGVLGRGAPAAPAV